MTYKHMIDPYVFKLSELGFSQWDWGLRWYGLLYFFGFIFVYVAARHSIKRRDFNMTIAQLNNLMTFLVIGVLLGGRLAYSIAYNYSEFIVRPWELFFLWNGGMSYWGGFMGAMFACLAASRLYRIPFLHMTDKLALFAPFGIALGHVGNFINGDLFGTVITSQLPWGTIFDIGFDSQNLGGGPLPRHPVQLYQSITEGWFILLSLALISKNKPISGTLSFSFLVLFGSFRFLNEFFIERGQIFAEFPKISFTQYHILSILIMIIGIILLKFINLRHKEQ